MRQFEAVANPSPAGRTYAPYLVILQSHHLEPLDSVVVAPAVRDAQRPLTALDILVQIAGEELVVTMADLASVTRQGLGSPAADLSDHEDQFRRALDRLFTGF